jgi:hypothetical protein
VGSGAAGDDAAARRERERRRSAAHAKRLSEEGSVNAIHDDGDGAEESKVPLAKTMV